MLRVALTRLFVFTNKASFDLTLYFCIFYYCLTIRSPRNDNFRRDTDAVIPNVYNAALPALREGLAPRGFDHTSDM